MFREKWIIIISLTIGLVAAGFFYFYSGSGRTLQGHKTGDAVPIAKISKPCVIAMENTPHTFSAPAEFDYSVNL